MTQTNNTNTKYYESASIKKLDGSMVEITGSISATTCESFRKQAIKSINDSVTIDGFRKGMVPENILISKVGEAAILEEMAELALSKAYVEIVIDNKLDAIGKPSVQVTKLAPGNPLEFKATTAVVPEVKLPDYKNIAGTITKSADPSELTINDKDVDEAILKIRKAQVSHEGSSSPKASADKHDHEKMSPEEHEKAILDSLPEFNDEFVRGLGGDFSDIEDFKSKVRVMIGENKKDEAREKLRIKIADNLVSESTIVLPEVMIESELNRTESQFKSDIERMGVKMEDYLKHSKKTLEEVRKEWRPHAEKKAKLQLILNEIAEVEKLQPSQKEIDTEVSHIVEHYKEADREHATVYAETVLTNEKVFTFLEKA